MSIPILIVDDEPNVRLMYRSALAGQGFQIFEASSGADALEECRAREHQAAILDLRMPGMDGFELLEAMHRQGVKTPVIFVTAYGEVPNVVRAMKLGAIDFLSKPPTPDELRSVLGDVLSRRQAFAGFTGARDCAYYLRAAKRSINLRDFASANQHLIEALDRDSNSIQAIHLVGVMLEMRQEHENALQEKNHQPSA